MSFLPALMPTPEGKKKRNWNSWHFGVYWANLEKVQVGRKLTGVWWEGAGAGRTDLGLCFDWIRWGQQGQTQDWFPRAESLGLCSVWKLSQLCSLILQLNSIQGKSELGVWRCRCARRFGGMEGWKDGDNGQLVLPFPAHTIPAVPRRAPIPVTPFQGPGLTLTGPFFFFFINPRVYRSRDFSYESCSLGFQVALSCCRLTRCLRGAAHSSPSWSCLLWGCPAPLSAGLSARKPIPQAVSQSDSLPALPACPRNVSAHLIQRWLQPCLACATAEVWNTEQVWAKISSNLEMSP